MPGGPRLVFEPTELNKSLLSLPYQVRTNWHVLTGAPSCGKTTLINLLAGQGYRTAPEGARLHLERELAKGRTLTEIRADVVQLQRDFMEVQLEIERGLPAAECIFLDRAVPDILAWYRAFGLDPNEFLEQCFQYQYASVFMLERLPTQPDGLRFPDPVLPGFLEEWHNRDYQALGYRIIRVPVLPPEERAVFILKSLSEEGLIPSR